MQPRLFSLQIGMPQRTNDAGLPDEVNGTYTTSFRKQPVDKPLALGTLGFEGDGQADMENHGGPDKAVNAYAYEHYTRWTSYLGLAEMPCGAFGENFTLSGLVEHAVCVGDTFSVGTARVQVSQPRIPCWKLSRRWQREELAGAVQASGQTGWYFRVLAGGIVERGEALELLDRPFPQWTVARANEILHTNHDDLDGAAGLAACPALADVWRGYLRRRVDKTSARG